MNRAELEKRLNFHMGRDEYQEALSAFEQAQRDKLEIHPCVFYIKEKLLAMIERHKDVFEAFV